MEEKKTYADSKTNFIFYIFKKRNRGEGLGSREESYNISLLRLFCFNVFFCGICMSESFCIIQYILTLQVTYTYITQVHKTF